MTRKYRRWTEAEDLTLRTRYAAGDSYEDIALILDRELHSVRCRVYDLRCTDPNDEALARRKTRPKPRLALSCAPPHQGPQEPPPAAPSRPGGWLSEALDDVRYRLDVLRQQEADIASARAALEQTLSVLEGLRIG
ncbi:MAG: hypothetical protein RI988_3471 [Pseudomonadota bacterium]|jgi:hypothetical protein